MYTSYSPKQIIKGIKVHFWWIGPYIVEKVLPNINYLVRKIGINKTQVLHRMRMCQFTPHQTPADIRIMPQERKLDPDVNLKHDDLYAMAWEYDYEQPIFDAENKNATPPNSHKAPVQSDLPTEETRNTPGTAHECSAEKPPQTEELGDVKDTYSDMETDMDINSEQPNKSPTKPRSSKYNLRQNPKPICNDDYR